MPKDDFMPAADVYTSVTLGQQIAARINDYPSRPTYNSALRHELATRGSVAAIALAQRLCGMTGAEATEHIAMLKRTKSHDIVSPHWQ